jgi:hypothetical protein
MNGAILLATCDRCGANQHREAIRESGTFLFCVDEDGCVARLSGRKNAEWTKRAKEATEGEICSEAIAHLVGDETLWEAIVRLAGERDAARQQVSEAIDLLGGVIDGDDVITAAAVWLVDAERIIFPTAFCDMNRCQEPATEFSPDGVAKYCARHWAEVTRELG